MMDDQVGELEKLYEAIKEQWPENKRTFMAEVALDYIREDPSEENILKFLLRTNDWNDENAKSLKRQLRDYLYRDEQEQEAA